MEHVKRALVIRVGSNDVVVPYDLQVFDTVQEATNLLGTDYLLGLINRALADDARQRARGQAMYDIRRAQVS